MRNGYNRRLIVINDFMNDLIGEANIRIRLLARITSRIRHIRHIRRIQISVD